MDLLALVVDLAILAILLSGFALFRTPRGARLGNGVAALGFAAAAGVVVLRGTVGAPAVVLPLLVLGSALGAAVAARVSMLQIPAMVAFQHGAGGVAAFLVSLVELWRDPSGGLSVLRVSALLGIAIGAGTFSASLIAAGKLTGRLRGAPTRLPHHSLFVLGALAVTLAAAIVTLLGGPRTAEPGGLVSLIAAAALGVLVAVRVGGADMPVLISFLNATAGLAAAFCGVVTQSRLLVACGAVVAASGSILTHVMCRAMNRGLRGIFAGSLASTATPNWLPPVTAGDEPSMSPAVTPSSPPAAGAPASAAPLAETAPAAVGEPFDALVAAASAARTVVIVPGYGMALAQAQCDVVAFATALVANGASVKYAIHPVAGRMPGHMNVLLAEAEASYEDLLELDEGNRLLAEADLAIVVGASDVVNPAAVETQGTPISGMPILRVQDARRVALCNLDERPGYSGVPNPLYARPGVIALFGDAKETFARLVTALADRPAPPAAA